MGEPVSVADELKDLAPARRDLRRRRGVPRHARRVRVSRARAARERRATSAEPALRATRCCSAPDARVHRAQLGRERGVFSELGRTRAPSSRRWQRRARARCTTGSGGIVQRRRRGGRRQVASARGGRDARRGARRRAGAKAARSRRDATSSLSPIADLLPVAGGGIDEETNAEESARTRGGRTALAARRGRDEILPFLARLLGLPLEPADERRLAGLHGDAMEKLILPRRHAAPAARGRGPPLVVVMDDLHWADISSVELVESLLRLCEDHPHPLRSGCFARAFPTPPSAFARSAHAARGALPRDRARPLDAGRRARMLRQPVSPRRPSARDAAADRGAGAAATRSIIEEVMRALVDEGAVEYGDGALPGHARRSHRS